MQTKMQSFIEACLNVLSGFIISMIIGHYLYPLYGFHASWSDNFELTVIFTVISVIRSYVWRRLFNYRHRLKST